MAKRNPNYLPVLIILVTLALISRIVYLWQQPEPSRLEKIIASGELRISTLSAPLTMAGINGQPGGLDYELAQKFARQLGVSLRITVRQNISQLFDDLDNGNADLLTYALISDEKRSQNYRAGPAYYTVSQQLVYRMGTPRPHSLAEVEPGQLTIAAGQSVRHTLAALKAEKYPQLQWQMDPHHSSYQLLQEVVRGKLPYTIADSSAINLMQRIYPQLAVAMDITEEQPVSWFSVRDDDTSLATALTRFFRQIKSDGTLSRLQEKYFGHGKFNYLDTRYFLQAVEKTLPALQPLFEKYAQHIDWRLLAAVAWQESHWDPQATSPTGVRGLMMLTRETAQSLGLTDRLDAEQSIRGGARYLYYLMSRVPKTVPENERVWFALAAYNMGYAHMLDARALTAMQNANPDSWADVKQRLPLLAQKAWYSKTTYGYASGRQAYQFVENIRKYQLSLVGYLQEKQRQRLLQLAQQAVQQSPLPAAQPSLLPAPHSPRLLPPRYPIPATPVIAFPATLPLMPFLAGVVAEKNPSTAPHNRIQVPLRLP